MATITRGLDGEAYDRQYTDKELIQRILDYFRPHWRKIIVISFSLLLLALTNAAFPLLVARGVNVMATQDTDAFILLLTGAAFVLGFAVWIFNWIRRQLTVEVVSDVVLAMRGDAHVVLGQRTWSDSAHVSSKDIEELG